LITSFLQGKVNPTMTSTIFNPYVDPATVANKTGYYSESPGAIPATNDGGVSKTVGVRVLRGMNDALPYRIRPIKAKRRYVRKGYTLGVELYTFRLVWRSHYLPRIKRWLRNKLLNKKVWSK
jgi:hypothetical protein